MIDLKIFAPKTVSTRKLREDLHRVMDRNYAYFVGSEASLSLYGYSVQQTWLYALRDVSLNLVGRLVVLTNDLNYFEEAAPYVPGGKISYTAKITFLDFDFDSLHFKKLENHLNYLNNTYQLEASKWSLL